MNSHTNQLQISGSLLEKSPCRYTPTGLPVVEAVLQHRSQQQEAGHARQVQCQLRLVAIGAVAANLAQAPLDELVQVWGFLAASSREPWRVRLHVCRVETRQTPANELTLPTL